VDRGHSLKASMPARIAADGLGGMRGRLHRHAWVGSVVVCSGDGIEPVCGLLTCLDGPADVPLDALETG
jgi:hypothetical protein